MRGIETKIFLLLLLGMTLAFGFVYIPPEFEYTHTYKEGWYFFIEDRRIEIESINIDQQVGSSGCYVGPGSTVILRYPSSPTAESFATLSEAETVSFWVNESETGYPMQVTIDATDINANLFGDFCDIATSSENTTLQVQMALEKRVCSDSDASGSLAASAVAGSVDAFKITPEVQRGEGYGSDIDLVYEPQGEGGAQVVADYCINATRLLEYSCSATHQLVETVSSCPEGTACGEGKCVELAAAPAPVNISAPAPSTPEEEEPAPAPPSSAPSETPSPAPAVEPPPASTDNLEMFCEDSDNGLNVRVRGNVEWESRNSLTGIQVESGTAEDECSGDSVREYFCKWDRADSVILSCPSGQVCQNGVCIKKSLISTPPGGAPSPTSIPSPPGAVVPSPAPPSTAPAPAGLPLWVMGIVALILAALLYLWLRRSPSPPGKQETVPEETKPEPKAEEILPEEPALAAEAPPSAPMSAPIVPLPEIPAEESRPEGQKEEAPPAPPPEKAPSKKPRRKGRKKK